MFTNTYKNLFKIHYEIYDSLEHRSENFVVEKDKSVPCVLENLLTSSFKITCLESYIDFANKLRKINFEITFLRQNKITMQHWTRFFKKSKVKAKMIIKQMKSPNVSPTLAFWAEWNVFKTFHTMVLWYIDVSPKNQQVLVFKNFILFEKNLGRISTRLFLLLWRGLQGIFATVPVSLVSIS